MSDVANETEFSHTADDSSSDFATALAMIAKLPLTDQEKAEAVRRLLAVRWQ